MRRSRHHRKTRLLLAVLATMTAAFTGLASLTLQPKAEAIVGAQVATEDYPFIVALKGSVRELSFCTGVLVDVQYVATAAHCVRRSNPEDLIIRIGTADQTSGGSLVYAKRIVRAPGGDLALVELVAPVPHQPIEIADTAPVEAKVLLLGYGVTCPVIGCGPTVSQLRTLESSIGSDSECGRDLGSDANELCVRNVDGQRGACYGDSGGPAIVRSDTGYQLVGVVSRGTTQRCGRGPAIYTDVAAFKSFIFNVIGRNPTPGTVPTPGTGL